ncbi:DUF222 domain-containing protein [Herbiconiux sp. 11R-BC]|uniref:HNH endonuclease signature motif containing protein n=1 Tax=Herbiconiux sp. 11R-BC TaxID=3111637 RepID=UPI003C02A9F2
METSPLSVGEIIDGLLSLVGAPTSGSTDDELMRRLAEGAKIRRLGEAIEVAAAGEVGYRSRSELGDEGLSRAENFTSPVKLVVALTGASAHDAKQRLEVGQALRRRELLGGMPGAEPFPAVAEALAHGDIDVGAARVITKECGTLAQGGACAELVADAERVLVDVARQPMLGADDVARAACRIRAHLDPDGAEPREERQQLRRSMSITHTRDGMYRVVGLLPPDQAAVWIAAERAINSPRTGPRFPRAEADAGAGAGAGTGSAAGEDEFVDGMLVADDRTATQKRCDAFTELITRAARASDMSRVAGSETLVQVHTVATDDDRGHGAGWADGIDEPLAPSVVERMLCHSPLVGTVFSGRGAVLHHGKARRLFTAAQVRAATARDGGCVWLGCDRPPAYCEAHHVDAWKSAAYEPGRTDIDNLALVCAFHHARLHKSSWKLVMDDGVPHLVPPAFVDPRQTPIACTRRRTMMPGLASASAVAAAALGSSGPPGRASDRRIRPWLPERFSAPPLPSRPQRDADPPPG